MEILSSISIILSRYIHLDLYFLNSLLI